jgi:hypothetical protein
MKHLREVILSGVLGAFTASAAAGAPPAVSVWEGGKARCSVILPGGDDLAPQLTRSTIHRYLRDFFDIELPVAKDVDAPGTYIVVGTPDNNPTLAKLTREGLRLTPGDVGNEGFCLLSHEDAKSKYIVVYGTTPRALKHGCQELIFFRILATKRGAQVDWPIHARMKPEFAYRGIYMLPCWAQHDSIESWKRVLRFNSELTLNRNWFWLDGFPVAGHKAISHEAGKVSDYGKTPLASDANVQGLIDLANDEDMKFYVGGGWMTWHHVQAAGNDPVKSKDYYLSYLRTFKGVKGLYFEPPGEGYEAEDWAMKCRAMHELIRQILADRPEFEFAVAIGRFNNRQYLKEMSKLDSKHVYWWWCWGDPFADKAFDLFPSVLSWHTIVRMSDIHGTIAPPSEASKRLTGVATSYDPGMGFGNPWNGGSTLGGAKGPRDFDPYTMPYFSHEYRFRERCWNLRISDEEFARRLGRRLFDADMPEESIKHYLKLADLCFAMTYDKNGLPKADATTVDAIDAFVKANAEYGTPRNRDTLKRMAEAIAGLRETNAKRAGEAK